MSSKALHALPKIRKEALELGSKYFYPGPCIHGHASPRLTKSNKCRECQILRNRDWRKNNPEYCREYQRQNAKKIKERHKQWYIVNLEKRKEQFKQWRTNNREKHKKLNKQWHIKNPGKSRALEAARRAQKQNAKPLWADKKIIKEIYIDAKKLEKQTGIKHHVDHIYPLKSDFLCGLHVENNLQILTAKENIVKKNRVWPGQLPCQTGRGVDHDWWRELNERIQSPSVSGGLSL